ncbi:MAG: hypothetical protein JXA25_02635 [Anaerolineales bacterium]|nr:hypothetical protein [Anaerolineales bacterium]
MKIKTPQIAGVALLLAALACTTFSGPSTEDTSAQQEGDDSGMAQTESALEAQVTGVAATNEAFKEQQTAVVETRIAAATPTTDFAATQAAEAAYVTAIAQDMGNRVEGIFKDGYLTSTAGQYYQLDDFNENWAQINWYQWWNTGYAPENFVIRADATWESASDHANFFTSGCGFVFRENGADNHYLVYLGMDGIVYFSRIYKGNWKTIGSTFYGHLDIPEDSGELMLAVEGDQVTVYIDGQYVKTWRDNVLEEGNLALTLLSGINTGFGTRCTMENVELWVLDP